MIVFGSAATNESKRHESRITMTKLFFAFGSGCGGIPPIGRRSGLTGLGAGAGFFRKRRSRPMASSLLLLAVDLLVVGGEHLGGRRTHDARVGELALAEDLADLRARDRHLRLARVLLDQADTPELLEVRREADVHGLDRELAAELLEDLLCVEVA